MTDPNERLTEAVLTRLSRAGRDAAIAAFAAAKGGNGEDALLMWNWLYAQNRELPSQPLQAFDDLEAAWQATR